DAAAETGQEVRREVRRRPASEVELDDSSPPAGPGRRGIDPLGGPVDLPLDRGQVGVLRAVMRAGDDDRAAAEVAEPLAEGQVEVERERCGRRRGGALLEDPGVTV